MRKRRQIVAVLASVALLSASLSAVADCASLCAHAPAAASPLDSTPAHCGHCPSPQPTHRQTHPSRNQQGRNCGQHCLGQAIAGKVSIATVETVQHAAHELLAVNNGAAREPLPPDFAPLDWESHSPPAQSGRSICRRTSLLRV
ncbi:MAG TPA: hypothetical protein VGZ29_00420 [Terriglobia bacterium]|nr:hypothetical protein [Terriglobia bacterium]